MDVLMPQLGETVTEGKVLRWYKTVGDQVATGENLFEVETDKVSMDVQAGGSGRLREILAAAGASMPVGAVLAVLGDSVAPPVSAPLVMAAPPAAMSPYDEVHSPTRQFGPAKTANGVRITPLARRMIALHGLDIEALSHAARGRQASRVTRADVQAALQTPVPAPAPVMPPSAPALPASGWPVEPFNAARRETGRRLTQSWQSAPHVFQAVEVDFSAIDQVRRQHKEAFVARHGASLTYLPFIARALAIAVRQFPRVNARLEGDGLAVSPSFNLGIAVDLAHAGLMVPVIRDADELTVPGLARALHRLVQKARNNELTPADMAGGTYTVSNNGSFGTLFTAPIINGPQVAILSTDAVRKKPVVVESPAGDAIAIRPVGMVAQSFDHRAFDGAYSAAFLSCLKSVLEQRDWQSELA
jgi:pyruvate/2-oxoglutarate dehydrogenase complex dihydrolipoamide acyltransferase (E2) component